jgi:hypothetical protein
MIHYRLIAPEGLAPTTIELAGGSVVDSAAWDRRNTARSDDAWRFRGL